MPRPPIELFGPYELHPRSWGREIVICHTASYLVKLLIMKAGQAGGLQYHAEKIESFFLQEGQAVVDYDAGDGKLTRLVMSPGMTVHVPAGAPHRVTAITDCTFIEGSTPVFDDRVRVEGEYGEPDTGGLPSTR